MRAARLDETKYGELLAKTRPHVIHNEKDLDHFTEALLELDSIGKPSREEQELAELLTTLIEQYESEFYRLRKARPTEIIRFLMEQKGLTPKNLEPITGSRGTTSDILNGKRPIGVAVAARLGEFFGVPPELFIEWKAFTTSSAASGD